MHDVGKVFLPKAVLEKDESLTTMNDEELKKHAQLGYNIVKENPNVSAISKVIILCHHEKEDGSGYPLGKGAELHVGAKIVGCCNLFHRLIEKFMETDGIQINQIIPFIRRENFNPTVIKVLETIINFYPVGSTVLLSNGTIGIVEKNFVEDLDRPLVRVVQDGDEVLAAPYRLELARDCTVKIIERLGDIPSA